MTLPARRAVLAAAVAELGAADPVLAAHMTAVGPPRLPARRGRVSHFESLARAIAFQQLAGRAAAVIWARVRALVPGPFTAPAVLALGEERLRGAGLSGAKAVSMLDLAAKVAGGQVRLGRIGALGDDEVVEHLVQVRGVGRWTAEMFLLFQLGRLDVWPVTDLGVRAGYARVHRLAELPAPAALAHLGERYRPWRSVVAWYCWRAVDTVVPDAAAVTTTGAPPP